LVEGYDGKITKVFMVDRIELAMLDQRLVVGRLDHCHTILFEEPGDRCDKAIGVGNVSERVVGMNDVRAYPLCMKRCMKRLGKVTREESAARGHANLLGGGGAAGSMPRPRIPTST